MDKKILIVDDHPVVCLGLTSLINSEPGMIVCGEADDCVSALDAIQYFLPDLVLVDLALKNSDGLDLVKKMKRLYPDIPALVLSMQDEEVYAERSLRAGAFGFVSKSQLDGRVLFAIQKVLKGNIYMSESIATKIATKFVNHGTATTDSPLDALSDRELQVYRLIGKGQGTRQIAETLNLSIKTIESHREHIKRKLDIKSGTALNRRAALWYESVETH